MGKYMDSGGLSHFWNNIKLLFENKSNKVTSISETSTDTEYPSAKAVYDAIQTVGGLGNLKIAYGIKKFSSSGSLSSGSVSTTSLDYSDMGFSGTPTIIVTPQEQYYMPYISSPTSSGCTLGIRAFNGLSSDWTFEIHWIAIGT